MAEIARPLGVTIIGVLYIIIGLLALFGGIVGGSVLAIAGLGPIGLIIGFIFIIVGIIDIIIAIGLFMAKGWAWLLAVIFAILNILASLIQAVASIWAIIGVIIPIIILWYLFQPNVKAFFGKA